MQDIVHADIFFFIASIALVIFTCVASIATVFLISILRDVKEVTRRVRTGVEHISESAEEIVDDIKQDGVVATIAKLRHREVKKRRVTK